MDLFFNSVHSSGSGWKNIRIIGILNLSDVLIISKLLKSFHHNRILNLIVLCKIHLADIVNEAPFNPSAVALICIFPGVVSGLTIARHIPCQVFFIGC